MIRNLKSSSRYDTRHMAYAGLEQSPRLMSALQHQVVEAAGLLLGITATDEDRDPDAPIYRVRNSGGYRNRIGSAAIR